MDAEEYTRMRACEDQHWWYAGMRDFLSRMIGRYTEPDRVGQVLDAGCGTGGNLRLLQACFPGAELCGADIAALALSLASSRHLEAPLIQASAMALPFEENRFDLVAATDVLYHQNIEEKPALREFRRVLKPGGILLMNLPAFECLRGAHDRAVAGCRRYTRREMCDKLKAAGFKVLQGSYWNFALFPAIWSFRVLSLWNRSLRGDLRPVPPALNAILQAWLRFENSVASRVQMPWGTSVFFVGKKI